MRKHWSVRTFTLVLIVVLAAGGAWLLIDWLAPMVKLLMWVTHNPEPATLACTDRVICPLPAPRASTWQLSEVDQELWFIYESDQGCELYSTGLPLPAQAAPEWTHIILPGSQSSAFRGFEKCGDKLIMLVRNRELKQYSLCYADVNKPEQWSTVRLLPGMDTVYWMKKGPDAKALYLLCRDSAATKYCVAAVPLAALADTKQWVQYPLPSQHRSRTEPGVTATQLCLVSSTKQGLLEYGTFDIDSAGRLANWRTYQISARLERGNVRLDVVDDKPVIAYSADKHSSICYIRALVSDPQSAADWQVSLVYTGWLFGTLLQQQDWQGKPVMLVADIGDMLILAKSSAPKEPQDWYIARLAPKLLFSDHASLLTLQGAPCAAYAEQCALHLVTYNLPPTAIPFHSAPSRLAALRQALPIDDIVGP